MQSLLVVNPSFTPDHNVNWSATLIRSTAEVALDTTELATMEWMDFNK